MHSHTDHDPCAHSPGAGAVVSAFMEERSIIGVCVVKDYIRVHMVYAGTVASSLVSARL